MAYSHANKPRNFPDIDRGNSEVALKSFMKSFMGRKTMQQRHGKDRPGLVLWGESTETPTAFTTE